MEKVKGRIPAEKYSQRYLKFKIHSDASIELSDALDSFWGMVHGYIGSQHASQADPWFMANKFDQEAQEGVVRVKKDFEDILRACLVLISHVDGEDVFFSVESVSGSLKKLD